MSVHKRVNSRGITFIEFLAATVLFMILLSVSVPILLKGVSNFGQGQIKSGLQDQGQRAAILLTKELRYAKEVSIVSTCPASGYNCLYVDTAASKSIKKKTTAGASSFFIADPKGKQSIQVTFSYTTANILKLVIQCDTTNQSYQIPTELALLNTKSIAGLASGQAIQYK